MPDFFASPPLASVANSVIVQPGGDIQAAIDLAATRFGTLNASNRAQVLLMPGQYTAPFTKSGVNYGWGLRLGGTGNDKDYISLRPMYGYGPSDVVITATGTSVNGGTPAPTMFDMAAHSEISDVTLVCSVLCENATPVSRHIHSDCSGSDNKVIIKGVVFRSTTGAFGVSSGIGGGQTLRVEKCRFEGGGGGVSCHGRTTGSGTAYLFFEDLSSTGEVYNDGSTKAYTGIEIDGQSVQPVHDLIAVVRGCRFPRANDASGGKRGLQIYHPPAAGDTILIQASSNASPSVITTRTAHGYVVGQTITISGHGVGSVNGTWVVASTPTEYTFTATGCNSTGGGAAGSITTSVTATKWTYVLDRDIAVDFLGTVGNHAWNCIQYPAKRYWGQTAGPTFTEGYVGTLNTTNNNLYVASGQGAAWPFVTAQMVDTPVSNRYPLPLTGIYAHVNFANGQAVALDDIVVTSATNGNATVDNTATDMSVILGRAVGTKQSSGSGRALIRLSPWLTGLW